MPGAQARVPGPGLVGCLRLRCRCLGRGGGFGRGGCVRCSGRVACGGCLGRGVACGGCVGCGGRVRCGSCIHREGTLRICDGGAPPVTPQKRSGRVGDFCRDFRGIMSALGWQGIRDGILPGGQVFAAVDPPGCHRYRSVI
ncbi:hypothetical protein CQ040_17135 [Microbacterium sp. MYb54]|nr:hypothetical protein CQ032_19180 [Microbacterium sp. MYb43]PRB18684.1 hypothetical protein CQ040_17135 [Microbacterium sp. MYb54]PRB21572.1 hypothetical protein CQ037_19050 [Microbacterium sp. MYb50]PRB59099.1 hypothetical protein CQ021_19570 [Microbacterium sp. MYb24]PRB68243.1 hypothetical protein CQ027_17745 [Microbacterium sp. MYb32]